MAKHNAFSLIELLVALGIIAALVGLAIPAITAMQKSYDSTGAESMINAALATARTLAMTNGKYAGVRFQKAWKTGDDAAKVSQYMIFIAYEEPKNMGGVTDAFRAIEGYKPIKLPDNMGVMDMEDISNNSDISNDSQLLDATRFSIIFSPSGKLVIHMVQTRYPAYNEDDDVINTQDVVDAGNAMFVNDNTGENEQSRNKFIIYDCDRFGKINKNERYSSYLHNLKFVFINPYTGEIIK